MSGDQLGPNRPVPGWAGYRMPVTGLYQTGASTHPGGQVTGFPGRNVARVVLDDLKIDTSDLMCAAEALSARSAAASGWRARL
jgi:phytoene dehydrogenase-like protein